MRNEGAEYSMRVAVGGGGYMSVGTYGVRWPWCTNECVWWLLATFRVVVHEMNHLYIALPLSQDEVYR